MTTEPVPGAAAWITAAVALAGALERATGGPGHRAGEHRVGEVPGWQGVAAQEYRRAHERLLDRWAAWTDELRAVARAADVWSADPDAGREAFLAALRAFEHGPDVDVLRVRWDVPLPGTPAELVDRWWSGLAPEQRVLTEALAGSSLGALGGVPLVVRDRVNRVTLRHDLAVDARSRPVQRALVSRSRERTWLLAYDRDAHGGDGAVAVGAGDLERDQRLAVLVPGVGAEAADVGRGMGHLEALRTEAGPGTSAIWWLGYDAPDGVGDPAMLTTDRAGDGGRTLARELSGLDAVRDVGDGDRVTVVGHSYGATTVAAAFDGTGPHRAEAVVLVGSPGAAGAATASDLAAQEVYVLRDSRDLVAALGAEGHVSAAATVPRIGLGIDPAAEEFGAVRLRAERPDRGAVPGVGVAHTSYFEAGSESLRSVGAAVRGDVGALDTAPAATDAWWRPAHDPEYRSGAR